MLKCKFILFWIDLNPKLESNRDYGLFISSHVGYVGSIHFR